MHGHFVKQIDLFESKLLKKIKSGGSFASFNIEITARCNNNCRHCYINLSVNDKEARDKELSFIDIKKIADEAVCLGAIWCLITGGEPFLRKDFLDIYLYLKKKGFLVSIFTNATLINEEHIKLFKQYPPRDIEVTVYGVTRDTYERVTRTPGSFDAFMNGLNLLLRNGIVVRFKSMAIRSNVHELPEISRFCRERTKDYFRFDPLLHLRFDGNSEKNSEIKSERLSPKEIAAIEKSDPERFKAFEKSCDALISYSLSEPGCNHLISCGAGYGSFNVSYDGFFRLCSSLCHPDSIYDLKKKSLREASADFVAGVRDWRSNRKEFKEKCKICPLINICMWCPAHAYLETGELDKPVDYFCEVTHARITHLNGDKGNKRGGLRIRKRAG